MKHRTQDTDINILFLEVLKRTQIKHLSTHTWMDPSQEAQKSARTSPWCGKLMFLTMTKIMIKFKIQKDKKKHSKKWLGELVH